MRKSLASLNPGQIISFGEYELTIRDELRRKRDNSFVSYSCEDRQENQFVIKIAATGREYRELLEREQAILQQCLDAGCHVARPIACDEVASLKTSAFLREYVRHPSLEQLAQNNSIRTPQELAKIFKAVCLEVHKLHSCGVLHLDLTPCNLLIYLESNTVFVIDFETACRIGEKGSLIGGKPGYWSPEQKESYKRGEQKVFTIQSDILTLGAGLEKLAKTLHNCHEFDYLINRACRHYEAPKYSSAKEFATELMKIRDGYKFPPARSSNHRVWLGLALTGATATACWALWPTLLTDSINSNGHGVSEDARRALLGESIPDSHFASLSVDGFVTTCQADEGHAFVQKCLQSNENDGDASGLLRRFLNEGLNPNQHVLDEMHFSEGLLATALKGGMYFSAHELLSAGACPHPFENLENRTYKLPLHLFPYHFLANSNLFSIEQKCQLAKLLVRNGAICAKPIIKQSKEPISFFAMYGIQLPVDSTLRDSGKMSPITRSAYSLIQRPWSEFSASIPSHLIMRNALSSNPPTIQIGQPIYFLEDRAYFLARYSAANIETIGRARISADRTEWRFDFQGLRFINGNLVGTDDSPERWSWYGFGATYTHDNTLIIVDRKGKHTFK